jgi:hypothetical protein
VAVWEHETKLTIAFHAARPISRIRLGSTYVPDSHPADNMFEVK